MNAESLIQRMFDLEDDMHINQQYIDKCKEVIADVTFDIENTTMDTETDEHKDWERKAKYARHKSLLKSKALKGERALLNNKMMNLRQAIKVAEKIQTASNQDFKHHVKDFMGNDEYVAMINKIYLS